MTEKVREVGVHVPVTDDDFEEMFWSLPEEFKDIEEFKEIASPEGFKAKAAEWVKTLPTHIQNITLPVIYGGAVSDIQYHLLSWLISKVH